MRGRLSFPSHSSLKLLWTLVCICLASTNALYPKDLIPSNFQLFQPCRSSFDCLIYIPHSHCDWEQRVCTCQPYHVTYNNSMCLPASLLGYGCALDSQCKMKVANSKCVDGLCECETNFMPLRKDKCLPPAKIGDYCLNDLQCLLASSYSFCKYIIPRIYGKCRCPLGYFVTPDGTCFPHLGSECENTQDCEEVTPNSYCESSPSDGTAYCACREGYQTSSNRLECDPLPQQESDDVYVNTISLGKSCNSSMECKGRDPYSSCIKGVCDCIRDNRVCNARNTGCHHDSFQCRSSGYCISWYFVCDKQSNCPDGSDEDECIPYKCPPQAFQCDDGTCLSRSLVCNGRWECPDGSDEARCYRGIPCDKSAFRCANGQCLPQYTFCNAVQDCADGSDESPEVCNKGSVCPKEHFQCRNGQCRSTAILCSGLDGCGDNSDETDCEACFCPKP